MILRLILFFLASAAMAGCAIIGKPAPEPRANVDYGRFPVDYKELIQRYMAKWLVDPSSAVYSSWRGPTEGEVKEIGTVYFGYKVCVEVNAKNRNGDYFGNRLHLFVINDGRIIDVAGGYAYGTAAANNVILECSSLARAGK